MTTETFELLLPEIVLTMVAVAIYVAGAFVASRAAWGWIALAGLALAAVAMVFNTAATGAGPLAGDALGGLIRWLAMASGAVLVLASNGMRSPRTPEYFGSLLLAIVGLMLVAEANELVLLFLGLELISIPTYVLLYLGRRGAAAAESAAKYFFLSVLASGLLLYGFSFLYGVSGSTDLGVIATRLADSTPELGGWFSLTKVALVLVFAGLGFKIAAVPFHFYAPDVYQGTSNVNAGLLSVLPKAAGLVGLVRIGLLAPGVEQHGWQIASALAVLTMTYGNLLALWQQNLRRLMAYSSIAHAGYMLVALAVGMAAAGAESSRWDGIAALVFYLCVYAVATLGIFAALTCVGRDGGDADHIDELAGLAKTRPVLAAALAVCLFSLAGVPPLAGFWGKLVVFAGALDVRTIGQNNGIHQWFVALAVIGMINAAVAAAYYLRVVSAMYFRLPLGAAPRRRFQTASLAAVVCAVVVVAIGVAGGPLWRGCYAASPQTASVEVSAVETK